MPESGGGHEFEVDPVGDAPVILAPRHLVGVLVEVLAAQPMVLPNLRATEPAKKALGLVDAHAIVCRVFLVLGAGRRANGDRFRLT